MKKWGEASCKVFKQDNQDWNPKIFNKVLQNKEVEEPQEEVFNVEVDGKYSRALIAKRGIINIQAGGRKGTLLPRVFRFFLNKVMANSLHKENIRSTIIYHLSWSPNMNIFDEWLIVSRVRKWAFSFHVLEWSKNKIKLFS